MIHTTPNALTSDIVKTMSSSETTLLIAQQQARIAALERVIAGVVQAETVLGDIRGDYCLDNMLKAADMVDNSSLRFSVPEVWKHLTMNVYRGLSDAYEKAPASGRSDDLYIMWSEASGSVKIGRTRVGAEVRARQLKVSRPDIKVVKVFKGLGSLEKLVHRDLKHVCVGGEWFGVTGERAAELVESVASSQPTETA